MMETLVQQVKEIFEQKFQTTPLMVLSPGRINIIGEHIDYNGGLVFPAAINKYICCAIAKNNSKKCRIYAADVEEAIEFSLEEIKARPTAHWSNYILGVIAEIQERRLTIGSFDLVFKGNIPIGAGLSSSAAFENAIGFGLNELFDLKLTRLELLLISQKAEHNFARVECGVMDQFASMMGKQNEAIVLDCATLDYSTTPIKLDPYQFVLFNSNVKHELTNSPYNERKNQCEAGFKTIKESYPTIENLCNVTIDQLNSVRNELSELVYKRCLFAISEHKRVQNAKQAIDQKDWKNLGRLLFESHDGLQHGFEVSCDELDYLVELSKQQTSIIGCRMMGGGFGGCTINLIRKDKINITFSAIKNAFYTKFGHYIDLIEIDISDGTKLIS